MSKSKNTRVVWDITDDIFCIETPKTHTSILFEKQYRDLTERLGLTTTQQGNMIDPAIWLWIPKGVYKNTMNVLVFSPDQNNNMQMVSIEGSEKYKERFHKILFLKYKEHKPHYDSN